MNFVIKEASSTDREEIKTFHVANHYEISVNNEIELKIQTEDILNDFPQLYDQQLFDEGKNWILFDENNNKIIGCISVFPTTESSVALLNNFSVDKSLRGQGFGLKLFQIAMDFAEKNYKKIILYTLPDRMNAAASMYERGGFKVATEQQIDMYLVWKMEKTF
jgi:ribosomal protein S18 acetylase RimI-like enzyme